MEITSVRVKKEEREGSRMKDRIGQVMPIRDVISKLAIRDNPGMVSEKFKDSLDDLKNLINRKE